MLVDIGGQLARDPAIRAEINRGMVEVLGEFVQSQKSGVGRFIADQVKSWDIDVLIGARRAHRRAATCNTSASTAP